MRPFLTRYASLVALVIIVSASARADAKVLVGLTPLDALRPSFGFSFGYHPSSSVVGVEVEYLATFPQDSPGGYSSGGIFASVIVNPVTISNVQIFAGGGVGVWGESVGGRGTRRELVFPWINGGGPAAVHHALPERWSWHRPGKRHRET